MNSPRIRAYLMLLLVAIIWGISGLVIKLTLVGLPPLIFLTYRFLVASIFALPFFLPKISLIKNNTMMLLFYAFLNSTGTLGLLFFGTNKTTLLDMSLISLFGPLLMIVAGYFFLKENVTKREKIGILIAFTGSLVIALEPITSNGNTSQRLLGNLLIFASLLTTAVAGLLVKKLMRNNIPTSFLANITFIVGFITLLPFVLMNYSITDILTIITTTPVKYHLGVLYMALISGTLAYSLYNRAQKTIELSEAALFSYVHPSISAMFALLLLGESMTIQLIVGGLIAVVGVGIAEVKKKRYNSSLK